MPRTQIPFFATRNDLLDIVTAIEAKRAVAYARAGSFDEPAVECLESLTSVAALGTAAADTTTRCPAYLVATRPFVPVVRSVPQLRGGTYKLDQLENPRTIVIRPAGVFGPDVLIAGSVDTVSRDPASLELFGDFSRLLRREFEQIKSYRVGRDAARLLDGGARLTWNARSPALYDLSRG